MRSVLIVSQEFDPHADHMVGLLQYAGIDCIRWPTNWFPLRSRVTLDFDDGGVGGVLEIDGRRSDLSDIRSVWYRHPAPFAVSPRLSETEKRFAEGEARAAFTGLTQVSGWFWVNHPDKDRVASSKAGQLKAARELGFQVPKTCITNDADAVRSFYDECRGEMIYKPFGSGFVSDTTQVCLTTQVRREHLQNVALIRNSPGIFQEIVPKKVDLRITCVGRRVFATEIHSQDHAESEHDWRAAPIENLRHCPHALPKEIEAKCQAFLDAFGLNYGAIDMIVTPDGEYVFLENNPSGQFGWIEGRTGEPLTAALAEMLITGMRL